MLYVIPVIFSHSPEDVYAIPIFISGTRKNTFLQHATRNQLLRTKEKTKKKNENRRVQ